MTPLFITLLRHDARLQLRNGIYYAYGFVLAIYVGLLIFVGQYVPSWGVGIIIYSDPSVLGFFFLGALLMLEKAEGARTALSTTPLRATDYFWSKTISLTFVTLVAVVLIGIFAKTIVNWPLYLAVNILTSISFIGIGFPLALHFKTVTSYLIGSAGIFMPLVSPMFLALIDPFPLWMAVFPTAAQFRLLLVSLGTFRADPIETTALLAMVSLTAALGTWLGIRALKKEFGDQ